MATFPITKRGAEKLKAELHKLKTVERPSVIAAISEARAQGDLSENAEYESAKDRQGFIEGRIQEVEGKLSAAQIIDTSELDAGGKVVFGATVELEEEELDDSELNTSEDSSEQPEEPGPDDDKPKKGNHLRVVK